MQLGGVAVCAKERVSAADEVKLMSSTKSGSESEDRLQFQPRPWERIAWVVALIAGVQAAYTTWVGGFQYMNARRDLILGIGQPKCLAEPLAKLVFWNDWFTCALGFLFYAIVAFGGLWILLWYYRPIQEALLNPFGVRQPHEQLQKNRRRLRQVATVGVIALLLGLVATLLVDGFETWGLMKVSSSFCPQA